MFTVIIPLYNKQLSIHRSIESVLNQTFEKFELIIVDDGSTDDSLSIAKKFNDDRIKIYSKKNEGVSIARNFGVFKASYEWICFLDADDVWLPYHLFHMFEMIDSFPDNKFFSTSFKFSNNKRIFRHKRIHEVTRIENYFKDSIKENLVHSNTVAIYKEAMMKVGMFNEILKIGEDIDLWARLYKNFGLVKSDKTTTIYYLDSENNSKINYPKLEFFYEYYLDFKTNNEFEYIYNEHLLIHKLKIFIVRNYFVHAFKLFFKNKNVILRRLLKSI